MIDVLAEVRAHLCGHFARAGIATEPDTASITFLGSERIDILRFGGGAETAEQDAVHYVSLGCSRHPMLEGLVTDAIRGPRAEVVVSLRGPTPNGLARSVAVLAAAPAVEGLILETDALVDLSEPIFSPAPFTAFLLGASGIAEVVLPGPLQPVTLLSAVPITPTEAAWVRLKGADAMREAWLADGVDVLDPRRRASGPA